MRFRLTRVSIISLTAVSLPGDACAGAGESPGAGRPLVADTSVRSGDRTGLSRFPKRGLVFRSRQFALARKRLRGRGHSPEARSRLVAVLRPAPSFRMGECAVWFKINPGGGEAGLGQVDRSKLRNFYGHQHA